MKYRLWLKGRASFVGVALLLLAATPAVLVAGQVRSPWIVAGATATVAVMVLFGATWQERYRGLAQRREVERQFRIENGCLVMTDGRLPAVRDIVDPVILGVHQALSPATAEPGNGAVMTGPPGYVPRDVDSELRLRLAKGGFVLLVGEALAGKSRTAFEAVASTLPDHTLIYPSDRETVRASVERASHERR